MDCGRDWCAAQTAAGAGSTSPRWAASACSRLSREEIRIGGEDRPGDREAGADEERAVEPFRQRDRRAVHAGVKQALGAAVGDRREDREAERAADLLGGVDQPRGEARLVRLGAGDRGDRHGDEGEPEPERREQRRPEDVRGEASRPARGRARTTSRPAAISSRPADQRRLEAHARDELPRRRRRRG